MPRYRLHGLTIDSEVSLNAGPPDGDHPVDVWLRREMLGECRGREVFRLEHPGREMTLWETGSGFRLEFPGVASIEFDAALQRGFLDGSATDGLASVLLSGPVAVILAALRGHSQLHASAVVVANDAVAFTGPRGSGKSVVARLASTSQLSLFSDDALRVDRDDEGVLVHRGTTTSRLRTSTGDPVQVEEGEVSADGRFLVRASSMAPAVARLRAIVFPQLSADVGEVETVPLSAAVAFRGLLSASALEPGGPAQWAERHFQRVAELARLVPAYALRVPWYDGAAVVQRDAISREVRALAHG